jgi:hypothetical protein
MRTTFRGYYAPSREELTSLWDAGLIVLDTNVLLNLYRYTEETRESLLGVLTEFAEHLWLPYQVAEEYHKQRPTIITEQRKAYEGLRKSVTSSIGALKGQVDKYRRHPVLEVNDLIEAIDKLYRSLLDIISRQEKRHSDVASHTVRDDDVLDRITLLYEGRVGQPYEEARFADIKAEGERRYTAKIPPGYADRNKPAPERYGDLVLWNQILDHVEQVQRPVILVTDDAKDDWWLRHDGETIGPRPELIAEMKERTGQLLHIYRAEQFARHARDHAATTISDSALIEIDHLAIKQEEERRILEKAREVLKVRHLELTNRVAHLVESVTLQKHAVEEAHELQMTEREKAEASKRRAMALRTRLQDIADRKDLIYRELHTLMAETKKSENDDEKGAFDERMNYLTERVATLSGIPKVLLVTRR